MPNLINLYKKNLNSSSNFKLPILINKINSSRKWTNYFFIFDNSSNSNKETYIEFLKYLDTHTQTKWGVSSNLFDAQYERYYDAYSQYNFTLHLECIHAIGYHSEQLRYSSLNYYKNNCYNHKGKFYLVKRINNELVLELIK